MGSAVLFAYIPVSLGMTFAALFIIRPRPIPHADIVFGLWMTSLIFCWITGAVFGVIAEWRRWRGLR